MGSSRRAPRILLVDDDELVRRAGARSLRKHLGAEVVEALGGMQALSLWRRTPEDFDVAVVDLEMPEMSGQELIGRFSRLAPNLPVVVWSGHAQHLAPSGVAELAGIAEPIAVVHKAADMSSLVDAVDHALGRSRRSRTQVILTVGSGGKAKAVSG